MATARHDLATEGSGMHRVNTLVFYFGVKINPVWKVIRHSVNRSFIQWRSHSTICSRYANFTVICTLRRKYRINHVRHPAMELYIYRIILYLLQVQRSVYYHCWHCPERTCLSPLWQEFLSVKIHLFDEDDPSVNGNDHNFLFHLQYVIEGVRGDGHEGDIAIDDIHLMDSCTSIGMPLLY
jgi:hypothetical protein